MFQGKLSCLDTLKVDVYDVPIIYLSELLAILKDKVSILLL